MHRSLVVLTCVVLVGADRGDANFRDATIAVKARQWPQADVLFHRDPSWLGSDADYSLPLGDGRTVAVQRHAHRDDAETCQVGGRVRAEHGSHRAGQQPGRLVDEVLLAEERQHSWVYFPEDGSRWFWPQHGIRLGRGLAVFLDRVKENPQGPPGFNFEGDGWRLAVIKDASGTPARWRFRLMTPPPTLARFNPGKAVNRVGRWVMSLALPRGAAVPSRGTCCVGRQTISRLASSKERNGGPAAGGGYALRISVLLQRRSSPMPARNARSHSTANSIAGSSSAAKDSGRPRSSCRSHRRSRAHGQVRGLSFAHPSPTDRTPMSMQRKYIPN